MGSGYGNLYTGTAGGSQPYAPYCHVDRVMHRKDVETGVYHDNRYDKNPTAQTLTSMVHGNYIGDKHTNIKIPYVIDMEGNIIVGKRNGNGRAANALPTPHPTLIGGKDPSVQMAGILDIRGGKIYSYDNQSGHFKPNPKSISKADESFKRLPKQVFHRNFTRKEELWNPQNTN